MFTKRRIPLHKKIRKRNTKSRWQKRYHRYHRLIHGGLIGSLVIACFVILLLIGKFTLFSDKRTMSRVIYSKQSSTKYNDPYLYKQISQTLREKNYFMMQRFHLDELKDSLVSDHPIVQDVIIDQREDGEVFVDILFHTPTIVFQTPSQKVAAYDHTLFPLVSGNTLGDNALTIQVPAYTSGFNDLEGILYKLDEKKLNQKILLIVDTLGEQHISEMIYLPGGLKLFVTYKNKKVYFHLDQEINTQLAKLIDLENYYEQFQEINIIDIGSVDDIIIR